MIYKILYPESYNKRAAKFLKKHPDLIKQYQKTLELLELNPYHPSLRLHSLQGQLKDLPSISINLQYRIVLELNARKKIVLVDVGAHDELYE